MSSQSVRQLIGLRSEYTADKVGPTYQISDSEATISKIALATSRQ